MMRKNIFSKKEFVDEVSKRCVLVEIDAPEADKDLKARSLIIAQKYNIEELPMIVLLGPDGKEFSRFFAAEHLRIADFMEKLNKELDAKKTP